MSLNPYATLGVARDANLETIKQAYRKKALALHPDRNPDDPNAEDAFKEISEAYSILSDPEQRAAYDEGEAVRRRDFKSADEILREYEEILKDILGEDGIPEQARLRTGADIQTGVTVSFEASLTTTTHVIGFTRKGPCSACYSTGSATGTPSSICGDCGGVGKRKQTQGKSVVMLHCSRCQGRGVIIDSPCRACHMTGRVDERAEVSVTVPGGVDNGTQLRLGGQGSVGERGGPAGDVYVRVEVQPHPLYRREGDDIHYQLPISYTQAVLGAEIPIPAPGGATVLKVPPGTHSGRALRLRGRGVQRPGAGAPGDLVVNAYIHVPTEVSPEHASLLEEVEGHHDPRAVAALFLRTFWSSEEPLN